MNNYILLAMIITSSILSYEAILYLIGYIQDKNIKKRIWKRIMNNTKKYDKKTNKKIKTFIIGVLKKCKIVNYNNMVDDILRFSEINNINIKSPYSYINDLKQKKELFVYKQNNKRYISWKEF